MLEVTGLRILIVVSSDFGDLGTAMYMFEGTGISAELLLPARLHQQNSQLAPHKVSAYSGAVQLLEKIRDYQPQLLLLLMAGVNSLLSMVDLQLILQQTRSMEISVATTDPLLGETLSEEKFHPFGWTKEMFERAAAIQTALRGVHHLYLSPMQCSQLVHSFFNSRVVISKEQKTAMLVNLQQGPLNIASPHWLFVISKTDYQLQCALYGRVTVDGTLLEKIQQSLEAKRQPVLLAPPEACQSMRGRVSGNVVLMPFCGYEQFRALLITAEHVFYWNVMSNSVLVRIANGGSVFFMDTGHLARYLPSILPLAMQSYYANAQLPMLDPHQVLDADDLADRTRVQPETFSEARAALQALPSTEALLALLCGMAGA
jgi:hypothetical protein